MNPINYIFGGIIMNAMQEALLKAANKSHSTSEISGVINLGNELRNRNIEYQQKNQKEQEFRRQQKAIRNAQKAAEKKEMEEKLAAAAELKAEEERTHQLLKKKIWSVDYSPDGDYTHETGVVFADTKDEAMEAVIAGIKKMYQDNLDIDGMSIQIEELLPKDPYVLLWSHWG